MLLFGLIGALFGCRPYDLDQVRGIDLGVPAAAVYDVASDGRFIVVFSDRADLCEVLMSEEQTVPPDGRFWVMSLTSTLPATAGNDVSADGYFSLLDDGEADAVSTEDATLSVRSDSGDEAVGYVDATFDGDVIHAKFDAGACAANLFAGVQ